MTSKGQTCRGFDQKRRVVSQNGAPDSATFDVERTAERAAAIVFARLLACLGGGSSTFTTRREGPRPDAYQNRPRAWRELAPRIPGAVRLGRWWAVSSEAYEKWLAAKAVRIVPVSPAANDAARWSPASVARDLGLRVAPAPKREED